MKEGLNNNALGRAELTPLHDMVAGAMDSWTLTYTVGSSPLKPGALIRVSTDSDTDCATPQIRCPQAEHYLTVKATDDPPVAVIVEDNRNLRLIVQGTGMPAGSQVAITYGDRSRGSPGMRNQTFSERRRY